MGYGTLGHVAKVITPAIKPDGNSAILVIRCVQAWRSVQLSLR